MFDIKISGGTIVDGSGGEPYQADVGIIGDRIVAIGKDIGPAKENVGAYGCIVTPGFVDIHTHYDAQVMWESRFVPSTDHGTTTVVMGSCGVGVAPCKPESRDLLLNLMSGVEDIPESILEEGLPWNWDSFPSYLDALEQRNCDADFLSLVPHGPLRVYVMGKRGADREPATAEDLIEMGKLVEDAIEAGALGFSTSRTLIHRGNDGRLAPAETASEEELMAIARAIRNTGKGVLNYIADFPGLTLGTSADFDLMCRFAETAGRPLSYTLVESPAYPGGWRTLLKLTEAANARGVNIRAQVSARAIGITCGMNLSFHPFSFRESYKAIADLPLAERVAKMKDPELRRKILSETSEYHNPAVVWMAEMVGQMFRLSNPPNYEPPVDQRLDIRAKAAGITLEEFAYDELLEDGGHAMLYLPIANYREGSLDQVYEMMTHPQTVVALGDGGAHYGLLCDAAYPTFALTHWVRDRSGTRIPLPEMVHKLTRAPAEVVGLQDRGLLVTGYKADLNIINLEQLKLHYPDVVCDLPSDGRRMSQKSSGYVATILSGQVVRRDDKPTGILPGRLVRGHRQDPVARVIERPLEANPA